MAVEQNWEDYADQAYLDSSDTILARKASGAGVEVPSGFGLLSRGADGIFNGMASYATYANGANLDFPNFSGLITLNDDASGGGVALFICGGGGVVKLGPTSAPAMDMTYQSSINGYRYTNNTGSQQNLSFYAVRTRANA